MAVPSKTNVLTPLPAVPQSWSELSWPQLCGCWQAKMRYGGNADVARAAGLLAVCGLTVEGREPTDTRTGESIYRLKDRDGQTWTTTARELAHLARQTMPWFDWPYGDQGDKEERDEQGKVIRERREGHPGYVHPNQQDWRDAMVLQEETVEVAGVTFALPQGACSNITWHQYRSLQAIAPQLWQDGLTDDEARSLHAQFLAYILVPAPATADTNDRFHTRPSFRYDAERAEASVQFWNSQLSTLNSTSGRSQLSTLNYYFTSAFKSGRQRWRTSTPPCSPSSSEAAKAIPCTPPSQARPTPSTPL